MADYTSAFKLAMRPKVTQIVVEDLREHDSGNGHKATWHKRKEAAKGSVSNLFKAARGSVRRHERHNAEEERLGPRPVSRKVRAVSCS